MQSVHITNTCKYMDRCTWCLLTYIWKFFTRLSTSCF